MRLFWRFHRHERHSTLRALARFGLNDLRVHGARPFLCCRPVCRSRLPVLVSRWRRAGRVGVRMMLLLRATAGPRGLRGVRRGFGAVPFRRAFVLVSRSGNIRLGGIGSQAFGFG